jgi:predicted ATP-grasp superfamily ATP-dependent carboligase
VTGAPGASGAVLVTDGEARAALACVRSLGARGCRVHVVAAAPRSLAGASRFAAGEHVLGDPARQPLDWARGVEELAKRLGAELVLPLTEVAIGTLHAFGVADRVPVACPPRAAYEAAIDKHALIERAAPLGIAAPPTLLLPGAEPPARLPEPFRYPLVVKPRRSRALREGRWLAGVAHVVRDDRELAAALGALAPLGDCLLQEFLPGHGEAIFLLASGGRTLARFAHRRLREKPPTGGVSVLRESIAPDPALLAASERLLQQLDWSGVAMVEFRRSPDGRAWLMEINPRLWGSLQLAIDAGVDFPALLLALQRGEPVPETSAQARLGVRTRWLLGDLDHLLVCLRRREVRALTGRSARRVVGDFLASFRDGSRSEVWRRDDRGPFWRELGRWLRGGSA